MLRSILKLLSIVAACVLPDVNTSFADDVPRLYWTTFTSKSNHKVQRANLDGSGVEVLITGLDAPWSIDIDPVRRKLYFGDVNRGVIQRANLDGTEVETLNVRVPVDGPAGLAIDPMKNDLYWSDFVYDRIYKTDLDSSTTTVLISSGLTNPFGLALDLEGGKLYWADTGLTGRTGKIQRSNLDGTNVEDLVTGLANPRDVAIDLVGGQIYWPDLTESAIYRANLDGTGIGAWLTRVYESHAIAIAPAGRRLYWTTRGDGISSIKLDGSGLNVGIVPPLGQYGIAIHVPEPNSSTLVGLALSGLFLRRWCRRSTAAIASPHLPIRRRRAKPPFDPAGRSAPLTHPDTPAPPGQLSRVVAFAHRTLMRAGPGRRPVWRSRTMSRTLILIVGAGAIAGSFLDAAYGGTIVENPLASSRSGEFSNLGPSNQQVADDFVLGSDNRIQSISWFGGYPADSAIVADAVSFSIRLFADVDGGPAVTPAVTAEVHSNALDTGLNRDTVSWLSYSVNHSFPPLDPGKYWLSVLETDPRTPTFTISQWLWADTTTTGLRAVRNADGKAWTTDRDVNHAFTIDAVPEPVTTAVVVGGLCLLLLWRRRATHIKSCVGKADDRDSRRRIRAAGETWAFNIVRKAECPFCTP